MSKWFKITGQNKKNAEIDIIGPIGGGFFDNEGVTKAQIKSDLKQITALKSEKITVNIASLGGSLDHALAIHDFLALHEAEITVVISGMTASAATVIAMAADKGKLKMSDNALFLVHNASGVAIGNIEDMKTAAKDLKKVNQRMANLYMKRTGSKRSIIEGFMAAENNRGEWWDGDEAKQKGFVDKVIEPTAIAALANRPILAEANLPKVPKALKKVVAQKVKKSKKGNKAAKSTNKGLNRLEKMIANLVPDRFKGGKKDKGNKKATAEMKVIVESVASLSKAVKKSKKTAKGKDKEIKALTKKLAKATGNSLDLDDVDDPTVGKKGNKTGIGAELWAAMSPSQRRLFKDNAEKHVKKD